MTNLAGGVFAVVFIGPQPLWCAVKSGQAPFFASRRYRSLRRTCSASGASQMRCKARLVFDLPRRASFVGLYFRVKAIGVPQCCVCTALSPHLVPQCKGCVVVSSLMAASTGSSTPSRKAAIAMGTLMVDRAGSLPSAPARKSCLPSTIARETVRQILFRRPRPDAQSRLRGFLPRHSKDVKAITVSCGRRGRSRGRTRAA